MSAAQYDWWPEGGLTCIEDVGHRSHMSVTNDAETVVREVWEAGGRGRFIYKDSTGHWDELLHEDGVFTGFALFEKER